MEEVFFELPNFKNLEEFLCQASTFPTLLLLRHGQRPTIAPGTKSKESIKFGLTEVGRIEAEMFGKLLLNLFKGENIRILGAHCSRSPRCAETAEQICRGFGTQSVLVETSPFLDGKGLFSGKPHTGQMIIDDPTLMVSAVNGEFQDLIENVELAGSTFLKPVP